MLENTIIYSIHGSKTLKLYLGKASNTSSGCISALIGLKKPRFKEVKRVISFYYNRIGKKIIDFLYKNKFSDRT